MRFAIEADGQRLIGGAGFYRRPPASPSSASGWVNPGGARAMRPRPPAPSLAPRRPRPHRLPAFPPPTSSTIPPLGACLAKLGFVAVGAWSHCLYGARLRSRRCYLSARAPTRPVGDYRPLPAAWLSSGAGAPGSADRCWLSGHPAAAAHEVPRPGQDLHPLRRRRRRLRLVPAREVHRVRRPRRRRRRQGRRRMGGVRRQPQHADRLSLPASISRPRTARAGMGKNRSGRRRRGRW